MRQGRKLLVESAAQFYAAGYRFGAHHSISQSSEIPRELLIRDSWGETSQGICRATSGDTPRGHCTKSVVLQELSPWFPHETPRPQNR